MSFQTYATPSNQSPAPAHDSTHASTNEMSLIFNTAFVRTRAPSLERNLATELAEITQSPACRALLAAAQELARTQNISELEAAEQMIQTFRKLDEVWGAYLHQEGLARLNSETE